MTCPRGVRCPLKTHDRERFRKSKAQFEHPGAETQVTAFPLPRAVTNGILFPKSPCFTLALERIGGGLRVMGQSKTSATAGADWTKLLTDPDLVGHLGRLLQTYRDTPPEKRDQVLLEVMREIKGAQPKKGSPNAQSPAPAASFGTTPSIETPPFEPDLFTPTPCWGQDRRRFLRLKCFVAVELKIDDGNAPVWGNLSNTSLGGCLVETATPVPTGVNVEIGLWLANGKLWVKGMILNGIVTRSSPFFGVRVKFSELETSERETLRQFLKFIESTTRKYHNSNPYLAELKR